MEVVARIADFMVTNGCKEPILSPLGIKVRDDGTVKVGEWEISHFYQDSDGNKEENSHFIEEGQTVVQVNNNTQ